MKKILSFLLFMGVAINLYAGNSTWVNGTGIKGTDDGAGNFTVAVDPAYVTTWNNKGFSNFTADQAVNTTSSPSFRNVTATENMTAAYYNGNGSLLTGIVAGASYNQNLNTTSGVTFAGVTSSVFNGSGAGLSALPWANVSGFTSGGVDHNTTGNYSSVYHTSVATVVGLDNLTNYYCMTLADSTFVKTGGSAAGLTSVNLSNGTGTVPVDSISNLAYGINVNLSNGTGTVPVGSISNLAYGINVNLSNGTGIVPVGSISDLTNGINVNASNATIGTLPASAFGANRINVTRLENNTLPPKTYTVLNFTASTRFVILKPIRTISLTNISMGLIDGGGIANYTLEERNSTGQGIVNSKLQFNLTANGYTELSSFANATVTAGNWLVGNFTGGNNNTTAIGQITWSEQ